MPRQQQPWFRFYVETFADRKVRRLPPAQRWVWAAVLGAAKESPTPGELYITANVPMTTADLAAYADVPKRDAVAAVREMTALGMVTCDDGVIRVCNFHRRQFLSDDVTARTRKSRTGKERSNDVSTNVPGNGGRNVPTGEDGTPDLVHAGGRARRADRGKTPEDVTSSSPGSRNVPPGALPRIVRAYVESASASGLPCPTDSQTKVERSAVRLFADGYSETDVTEAAKNAAVAGYVDLAQQMQRDAARAKGTTNAANGSTADQRYAGAVKAGQDTAAELRAINGTGERRALA